MSEQGPGLDGVPEARLVRLAHGTPAERAELAALAAADPGVAGLLADWDRQDAALAALYGPVADEPVPHRLRALVVPRRGRVWPGRIAAALALVALGAAGGWGAAALWRPAPAGVDLAQAALRSHATFVVETAHPVEVPAADEAHLVRWLSNRLGHRIVPPDLDAHGFRLIGGRVVPGATGAAAMLMYEDEIGRRVTLYVARSATPGETAFREVTDGTLRGFWWIEDELGCAVVGDLPRDTLRAIAVAAYHDLIEA